MLVTRGLGSPSPGLATWGLGSSVVTVVQAPQVSPLGGGGASGGWATPAPGSPWSQSVDVSGLLGVELEVAGWIDVEGSAAAAVEIASVASFDVDVTADIHATVDVLVLGLRVEASSVGDVAATLGGSVLVETGAEVGKRIVVDLARRIDVDLMAPKRIWLDLD